MPDLGLLAMDLDGTLLSSRDTVSDANIAAVRAAAHRGVIPVVATGRVRGEAQFALDRLGTVRYFIGMNGGRVEDLRDGTVLADRPFAPDTAEEARRMLERADCFYQIYADGGVYCTERNRRRLAQSGLSAHYVAMFGPAVQVWEGRGQIYKFLAVTHDLALRQRLGEIVGMDLVTSLPGYCELIPTGLDKAVALAELARLVGIGPERILAIGDSENDRGMLRMAGRGVAMGNAGEALRRLADWVAPTNDEDGVAWAIRRFLSPAPETND